LGFRLNAPGREHVHLPLHSQRDRLGQQPRLADARIAAHDERGTSPFDVIQKPGQDLDLGGAASERRPILR
jgi:hypothetical protein